MNKKLSLQALNRLTVDEFKTSTKKRIIIVLDNIRSLNNIGSVFRTADSFRIEAVYLCGITAQPPHRDIQKTALGATESVNWKYFNTTHEAVEELKEKNFKIASIEQAENSTMLHSFKPKEDESIALILGNEVKGVDQTIIDKSDYCIEIEQHGTKHSLNVAVCTGIIVYDIYHKLC